MDEGTTHVGMDVHKRTIAVSIRFSDGTRDERTIPHETRAVHRRVRKMKREAPGAIACASEAGPCGYGLQREFQEQGLQCQVIAPSLIPRKPGDRIKTDRRDARKLAELLLGGLLTEVHPPIPEDEAVRDRGDRATTCGLVTPAVGDGRGVRTASSRSRTGGVGE